MATIAAHWRPVSRRIWWRASQSSGSEQIDQDHVLHQDELSRLDEPVAGEMPQKGRAEEGVGAPEHRSERDEDHGEAVGEAAHEPI